MQLIRKDKSFTADPENPNDYYSQREYGFDKIEDDEMSRVRVDFPDFGHGEKRRPGFAVEVDWIDVRSYLAGFWSPDDLPTKEFFDAISDAISP